MTNAAQSASSPRHKSRDAKLEGRRPSDVDVLIVRSGFSGTRIGVRLRQSRNACFLIIEKAADLGGTWRDNRYRACAWDIASHLYSLSFAPRSDWRRLYRSKPELWEYRC
jgi:cation diffusion facilitator CzcD-associated flavoprotein CzcO